jgi:hypothetical protein
MLGSLCVAALTLAAGFPVQTASAPVFKIFASIHYGQQQNASGYSAVVAVARGDAWVFGGTNPGAASSPTAEHWDGQRWRASHLPAGLSGFIVAADASSARNIWAVGDGYALQWNGSRWAEARTWSAGQVTSVAAISPRDVWVFGSSGFGGQPGIGAWHYTGRSWIQVTGIAASVYRASALSATDIWAVTFSPGGGSVLRYDGTDWDPVAAATALANTQLSDILAQSPNSVWVSGISPASGADGHVVLAHWNGRSWTRYAAPWQAEQAERFTPDGAGGIWIPVVTDGNSPQTWILHLSRSGRWTRAAIAAKAGAGLGVGDLALIPGTRSVWGAGGVLTATGGDAVILGGGTRDWLAAVRSPTCPGHPAPVTAGLALPDRNGVTGPVSSSWSARAGRAAARPLSAAKSARAGRAAARPLSPDRECVPGRRQPVPPPSHPRPAGPLSGGGPRSGPGSLPDAE